MRQAGSRGESDVRTAAAGATASAPGTRPFVVVISGATATGKTELAVRVARALGGELVGADSVQVYRTLDIGSGKPRPEELHGVRHHLLDVIDPGDAIDAARFASLADAAIADILSRGRLPIVVGGTGLWIRALVQGLAPTPAVDGALRARLGAEVRALGAPALHARLRAIDPAVARGIHENDAVRITRALEIAEQTGARPSDLRAAHRLAAPRLDVLVAISEIGEPERTAAIDARVRAMLAAGWIDETRAIVLRHGAAVRALHSVGYRDIVRALEAGAPIDEAALHAAIVRSTRTYARRQRTWWAKDPSVALRGPASALEPTIVERVRARVAVRE